MKAWQSVTLTGITAMTLLGTVACMPSNFRPVAGLGHTEVGIPETASPTGNWEHLPDGENTPIPLPESKATPIASADAEPAPSVQNASDDKKDEKIEDQKAEAPKTEMPKVDAPKNQEANNQESNTVEPKSENPAKQNSDFTGPGVLKPTVYYFVTFNEDELKCTQDTLLHGKGSLELIRVCKKTEQECGQQGSCAVIQNGKTRSFNVIGRFDGHDRYFEIEADGCKFGYGVRQSCLDPYYTLAADMHIYKPGQVIYIPGVVGTDLPDGTKHTGYFVIRDQGRGIKGAGRFDFFTGTFSWRNSQNPFKKLGLGDVNTHIPYYKVGGKTAQTILKRRAYPQLPMQ